MKETAYKVGGNTIPLKSLEIKNRLENLYSCSIHGKTIEIMTEEINGHILSYTTLVLFLLFKSLSIFFLLFPRGAKKCLGFSLICCNNLSRS